MAIIASALALALAALPQAGTAASQTISPAGRVHDQFALDVAADSRDAAIAGWTVRGRGPVAQVAVRAPGTTRFGRPVTLGPGRMSRVAVAGGGRAAAAAWLDRGTVRAARRTPSGPWRTDRLPGALPARGVTVAALVALTDGGAAMALESRTADGWTVTALRRSARGIWRRAAPDLEVTDSASGRVEVDRAGRVVAVWLETRPGTPTALRSATLVPGRRAWSAGATVATAPDGRTLAEPVLAVDARGGPAVLVTALDARGAVVWSRVAVRTRWAPAWRRSPPTPATSVAVAGNGVVWATWSVRTGSLRRPFVARLVGGRWRPAERPGAAAAIVGGPVVATSPAGAPAIWWLVDDAGATDRWVASTRGRAGWSAPVPLGRTSGAIAVTPAGRRGTALWVAAGARGGVLAAPLR